MSTRTSEGDWPLVTVAMPSYNSARFISRAISSLLEQTYPRIEIVISDDGSSDGTAEIVRDFAGRDRRVRVQLGPRSGERANFNCLLSIAAGPYFMWAADHDTWDPQCIASCVSALEADPDAVLAYSHTMEIDADDHELGVMDDELDIVEPDAAARYRKLIWRLGACNAIYGVMRTSAVQATGGYGETISPDHLVLAKMALLGTFIQLPEAMYRRRRNRPPETGDEQRQRQIRDLLPDRVDELTRLEPNELYRPLRDAHLRLVMGSELPLRQRASCYATTLVCFRDRFGVQPPFAKAGRVAWHILPRGLRSALARNGR